ncbi:hypothetical protein JCM11251_000251 [Rhodosporidiobolus azoricus]
MRLPDESHRLIPRHLPFTSAFLCFDGEPAEPLGACDFYKDRAFGYVEAKEGAVITAGFIDHRVKPEREAFVVSLRIDGTMINAATFMPEDKVFSLAKSDPKRTTFFEGQLADDNHLRLIRLAPVSFSSDEAFGSRNPAEINKIGLIHLQYHRIENLRWAEPVYPVALHGVVLEEKPEAEKDMPTNKPTHQAYTAESIEHPTQRWLNYDYIDEPETPYFTFEWRVKSRQTLIEWTYLEDSDAHAYEDSPELTGNPTPSTSSGTGYPPGASSGFASSSSAATPLPLKYTYGYEPVFSPTPSTASHMSKEDRTAYLRNNKARQAQLLREVEELASLAEDEMQESDEADGDQTVRPETMAGARTWSTTATHGGSTATSAGRAPVAALEEMMLDSSGEEGADG